MRYLKEATAAATSGVLKIHCACGVLGPWVCQRPLGFWVLNPVSRAPGAIGFLGPPTTQDPRGFIWTRAVDLGHYPGYGFQNPPVPHLYPTRTPPVPHSRKSAGGRTPPVPQPYPTCTPTVPQLGFSIEPDRAGFLILYSKIKPVRSS